MSFLGPPMWAKSNTWKKKEEEKKYVLTMASYACERKPPGPISLKIQVIIITQILDHSFPLP